MSEQLSYKDMPLTYSTKKIITTKEYLEFRNEQLNKLVRNEIGLRDISRILRDKVSEISRYLDSKRKQTGEKVIKELEDVSYVKTIYKYNDIYTNEDIEEENRYIYEANDLRIEILKEKFIKETLESMINRFKNEFIQTIEARRPDVVDKEFKKYMKNKYINAYLSYNILGTGAFDSYMPKVKIYENDEMMEEIEENVGEMLERYPEYDDKDTYPHVGIAYFTLSIVEISSVRNWWNHDVNKFMKYEDFKIFTANDTKKNCLKQCVEYLGYQWKEESKIDDIIKDKKIIRYTPITEMRNVQRLKDLASDYHDISNIDCDNVVRIIEHKDHMAVITNIERAYVVEKVQSNKRKQKIDTKYKEVFMDIESFTRKDDNSQIPYLICWSDDDTVKKESGKECMEKFISRMINDNKEEKYIILYAWYGSGYDYQHILPYLKMIGAKEKIVIRNTSIIYAEFELKELGLTIALKDPYLFLLASLDSISKSFNVTNKGEFPHRIIEDWEDLDVILEHWIRIERKTEEVYDNDDVAITVNNIYNEIEETEINDKTILQKAEEYCSIDVIAMKEVWKKFKKLMKKNLNMDIGKNVFTLSQLSMNLMETSFHKNIRLYVPELDDYEFIKDAIYGGRVIAKNGIYEEDIIYADVVSLYPSSMKLLKHGYGEPTKVSEINWNKHGIYKVRLKSKYDVEPENCMHFVPRRINGRLTWEWFKECEATYHTYDLLIAKEEGYEIECIEGIEYKYVGYIFENFIDKLYKLKDEHSNCDCNEQPCPIRMIAKIALNGGGFGKFVQKPIEKETYIVDRDVAAGYFDRLEENEDGYISVGGNYIKKPKFYNLDGDMYDKMVLEITSKPAYATQNGISILSGSRYRLYQLCKSFGGFNILYSDTDSIFIRKSSIDYDKFKQVCGNQLGMLDDTVKGTIDNLLKKLVVCGPKMYGYRTSSRQESVYCKGVPKNMVNIKHLETMINQNKDLEYIYTILKRGLTGIKERNVIKRICQTKNGVRVNM